MIPLTHSFELISYESAVCVWPAVPKELPRVTHLTNFIEVKISYHERIFIARCFRDKAAARIAKVALTVEFTDVPGLLVTHTINCADKVAVSHGMSRLLETPQVF